MTTATPSTRETTAGGAADATASDRPRSLIVLGMLPLFLFWKCYSVFAQELAVQEHWHAGEFAACFVQDLAVWCLLFLAAHWLFARRFRWATAAVLVVANLILLVQVIDARVKLKFLEPLSLDLITFASDEADLLAPGSTLFLGDNYWKAGLLTHAALGVFVVALLRMGWFASDGRFGKPLARVERVTRRAAVIGGVAMLLLAPFLPAQAYGLHQNFFFASATGGLFSREVAGHRGHRNMPSPEPVRYSSADDFAHVTTPEVAVAKGYNVILYVLESTPTWAIDLAQGSPRGAFYRDLIADGALARPCYATFAGSTKSMFILQTGTYASPTQEVLETQVIELAGLPRTLRANGYYTEFISAQHLHYQGSRYQYEHMGYHEVIGLTELSRLAREKGVKVSESGFGDADDRLMFLRGFERLRDKQPFLLTFYTSASHYPYDYPGNPPGNDLHRYLRAIEFTQMVLREMVADLEAQGLMDNTLLVITSDHGEEFDNGNFLGRGTTLSEQTHRVPLIIYARGKDLGGYSPTHTRHVDVCPTVLDLLGIAPEGLPLQGVSLFKVPAAQPVYMNTVGRVRSIGLIEDGRKLIHSLDTGQTLFTLLEGKDPDTRLKRADPDEFADAVRRMKEFNAYNEALMRDRVEEQEEP